jgi:hypothetical protein
MATLWPTTLAGGVLFSSAETPRRGASAIPGSTTARTGRKPPVNTGFSPSRDRRGCRCDDHWRWMDGTATDKVDVARPRECVGAERVDGTGVRQESRRLSGSALMVEVEAGRERCSCSRAATRAGRPQFEAMRSGCGDAASVLGGADRESDPQGAVDQHRRRQPD